MRRGPGQKNAHSETNRVGVDGDIGASIRVNRGLLAPVASWRGLSSSCRLGLPIRYLANAVGGHVTMRQRLARGQPSRKPPCVLITDPVFAQIKRS
eukprot:2110226-Rhodomonas_salina.1